MNRRTKRGAQRGLSRRPDRRVRATVGAAVIYAFASSPSFAGDIEPVWIGPPTGVWSFAGNWSTGSVPQNGAETVIARIDDGARQATIVTLDMNTTLSGLVVDANDRLKVKNGRTLGLDAATLDLDGTIELASTGLPTVLLAWRDLLQAGGVIELGANASNRVETFPGKRWTIAESAALRGAGTVAPTLLSNLGLVEATGGGTLFVNALGQSENRGTLRSVGATLQLTAGNLAGPGTIAAGPGGLTLVKVGILSAQTLDGGDGTLQVQPTGTGVVLVNSAVEGTVHQVSGTVTLNTSFTLGAGADYVVASGAKLSCPAPGVTLASPGGGSVRLLGSGTTVSSTSTTTTLTIAPGCTLRGIGQVQVLTMVQQGTVRADAPGTLLIGNGPVQNQGLLDATIGTLHLFGSTATNSGQIRADGAGTFRLESTALENAGTITATNGGTIRIAAGATLAHGLVDAQDGTFLVGDTGTAPVLKQLAVVGDVVVEAGKTVVLEGTQSFFDRVVLLPSSKLSVKGAIASLGDGFDRVSMGAGATVAAVDGTSGLWVGAGKTIEGEGTISCPITNGGTVRSTVGAGLTITAPLANNALIEAASAPLVVKGALTGGGVLRRQSGVELELVDASVVGAAIESLGDGAVVARRSTPANTVTLNGFSLDGALVARTGLVLQGTILNEGELRLEGVPDSASMAVSMIGTATLTGRGACVLLPGSHVIFQGGGSLVNGAGHTIRGEGNLGGGSLKITNAGTIRSEGAGLLIQPPAAGFINEGTLVATDGDVIALGGTFTHTGAIEVGSDHFFLRDQALTQTGGTIDVDGTLLLSNGTLSIAGGTLRGGGEIVAPVVVSAATIDPDAREGDGSGDGFGTLSTVSLSLAGVATTHIDVGPMSGGSSAIGHDAFEVAGGLTLGGTLEIEVAAGAQVPVGTTLVLFEAGGPITGSFSSVVSTVPVAIVVGEEFVAAVVQGPATNAADLDGDGLIGPGDVATLLGAWGACAEAPCVGDLNGDGMVGAGDLAQLLGMWPGAGGGG